MCLSLWLSVGARARAPAPLSAENASLLPPARYIVMHVHTRCTQARHESESVRASTNDENTSPKSVAFLFRNGTAAADHGAASAYARPL